MNSKSKVNTSALSPLREILYIKKHDIEKQKGMKVSSSAAPKVRHPQCFTFISIYAGRDDRPETGISYLLGIIAEQFHNKT